jgi:hypothetical protein
MKLNVDRWAMARVELVWSCHGVVGALVLNSD